MKNKREVFFRKVVASLLLLSIGGMQHFKHREVLHTSSSYRHLLQKQLMPHKKKKLSSYRDKWRPPSFLGVIPQPTQYEALATRTFAMDKQVNIFINTASLRVTAQLLKKSLQEILPYPISIAHINTKNLPNATSFLRVPFKEASLLPHNFFMESTPASIQIYLIQNNKDTSESYELKTFTEKSIIYIKGGSSGVFYGAISLLQLLYQHDEEGVYLPRLFIKDTPNFAYRGLHLDVARHFFSMDEIKKLIKWMAFFKLNKLHLHLSDDQGWRIEIKSFPQLTQIGARRKETLVGRDRGYSHHYVFDKTPYEGYYTQQDIKGLLYYARIHQVEIIPEIDMPSHVLAMVAAYPFLACDDRVQHNVQTHWRGSDIPLCLGKESTYKWIFKMLTEVAHLFPSPYFHIGQDETQDAAWLSCVHCKKRMKKLGIKNAEDYHYYFLQRIVDYLHKLGKRPIIWDDAFRSPNRVANLSSTTLMVWKEKQHIAQALSQKIPTIVAMHQPFYLNYYQVKPYNKEPLAFAKTNTLSDVYQYALPQNVLGAEALLWTEYVRTMKDVEYQLFPRLIAAAENFWTLPQRKSYASFLSRLQATIPYLNSHKIRYAPHFIKKTIINH